jgi:phenylpyruvate tautomerase PptA (4-oxalocrotonate tautomerase family)
LSIESELKEPAMPKIDLTFSAGALSAPAQRELPAKLAAALLRREGAPNTAYFRSIAWTHLHELAPGATHDADGPAELSHFIVDVTIPQGAFSDRRRAGFISDATDLIQEAAGLSPADTRRIWVIVHEMPDGHWGAEGEVVRIEELREAARTQRAHQEATIETPEVPVEVTA